jgi:predicted transcriptional regulator
MKISEIINILEAELISGNGNLDIDVCSACGSDLMSDVMAYVKESVVLLTGLVNPQVIRTAEMMDIKAIVFVRGKKPDEKMIDLAQEKGITILTTGHPMFIACGKLYNAGLVGRGVWD